MKISKVFSVVLCAVVAAACSDSVAPESPDAACGNDGQAQAIADASPGASSDVSVADASEDASTDAASDAGDSCDPCMRLRECCMIEWGPGCEVIDRNFSVDWCQGRYRNFVRCSPGCETASCDIVRSIVCE